MNRSPLHNVHVRLGARMVPFAGWEMPLTYGSIIEEHHYTRNVCSLFDVSHMGRLKISGEDAEAFLERLCTRKLADAVPGQCRYSHVCREDGGILDDVIVSRYEDHWGMVCNGSNRDKIVGWLQEHIDGRKVVIEDQTLQTAMVAIQGPKAIEWADELLPAPASQLKRYRFTAGHWMGFEFTVFRSGYTGEDGVEIVFPANLAETAAGFIFPEDGPSLRPIKPAGLGARDTLRLEAAMPLYGHELFEEVDSLSAGQGWCVSLDKDFIGARPMRELQEGGLRRRLVGLRLSGKRTARQHDVIYSEGAAVGEVTSGTLSPTLQQSIAMGYVPAHLAEAGTGLAVEVRGQRIPAEVVPMPFYKRVK